MWEKQALKEVVSIGIKLSGGKKMTNLTTRKPLLSVLISQILALPTSAAVVGNIQCGNTAGLISAITTANTTPGADEINLNIDNQANCVYLLTRVDNNTDGANGLPSITDSLTINGNHSAIRRQDGSLAFRIIHVASTGQLTLKQLSVEKGAATGDNPLNSGGGVFNHGGLTLEYSTISGNTANWAGGGIVNYKSTTTLTNSTVSGNTAQIGSGIANYYSTATLTNCTILGNTAKTGGGIANYKSTATLTNSTVSGNTANLAGGGIYNVDSTATLTNSTVSGNTATVVGGILNYVATDTFTAVGGILNYTATATLKNTILAGNTATDSNPDCFNWLGTFNTNHHNLLGGDDTTECHAGATDLTLTTLGMTITDVLNPTLADNGGPTQTLALVENSPAIDAADNAVCPATDQRGVSRPQGAKCDIGAFEYQKPALIELGDFQAFATSQGIYLKWITNSASNNAGFRLWRANLDPYGGYTNITALDYPQAQTLTATPLETVIDWSHLIPAAASAESCYSYLDTSAMVTGMTYFYLLEDINMAGYRTFHWKDIASATIGQNSELNPQCEIN